MPPSTQSFTLDDAERRRILYGSQSSQNERRPRTPSALVLKQIDSKVRTANASQKSALPVPIFEFSYSQNFTQTQEDPSSFKQQIDAAPPVEREVPDVVNVFDEEEDFLNTEFRPLETSTAIQAQNPVESFSPPSTIDTTKVQISSCTVTKAARTPAVNRTKAQDTPAGLTQMFQSSQDTPVLQQRKSTYVSMKDSQQHRLPDSDEDDSGDDDIDFPKIRRGSDNVVRSSAAHSIMDRLRERTGMSKENKATVTGRDKTVAIASDEPSSPREPHHDNSVIPATAPVNTQPENEEHSYGHGSDSIVTESQLQAPTRDPRPPTSPAIIRSSQANETIQFDLPSSFPDIISHSMSSTQASGLQTADKDILDETPNQKELPILEKDCLDPDRATDLVKSTHASLDAEQQDELLSSQTAKMVIHTGHKEKPILLKETPFGLDIGTYDLSRTERRVKRSASHSLCSTTTPIYTSAGISHRSKSMYTPMQLAIAALPDFSSPVQEAGNRRRSRRTPVIAESPVDTRILKTPRKRELVLSSLPHEDDDQSFKQGQVYRACPRKRLKSGSEVRDSQSLRQPLYTADTPAQPVFHILKEREVMRKAEATGSDMSRTASDQATSRDEVSSPLTSLASEDFLQDKSSPSLAVLEATIWSKRVLALHRETESYFPGVLVDNAAAEASFAENTIVSIAFDDTDKTEIELLHVRPLDLRIGDVVKVDVPKIKTKQLIITSLLRDDQEDLQFTDIYGHTSFEARRKDNGSVSRYTIKQLYLPQNLMKTFFKRQFASVARANVIEEPATPSRRQPARDLSPTLSYKSTQSGKCIGLFCNISFSVSISNPKTVLRDKVERKVGNNGGHLLSQGLDELFENSPFQESRDIAPLQLTQFAKTMKAAIVLADQPSRRAKYLQALSLGLPCLHFSYIDDCLNARKLLDFQPYLLAAGDGLINGHSVSMSMSCSFTSLSTPLTLPSVLPLRRRIYDKKNIIIVTGNPTLSESRRIHYFLTWAMCASDITDVPALSDASRLLTHPEDGKRWDLVSVPELTLEVKQMEGMKGKVVTSDDVVQSLITGRVCVSY